MPAGDNLSAMNSGRFDLLTASERNCLRLALTRDGSKDIAPLVGLTHHTVDKRFKSAIRKLGARNRFQAARMFAEFEAVGAAPDAWDQSPDTRDQPPAVAHFGQRPMMARSIEQGASGYGMAHSGGLREDQAPFLTGLSPREDFPLWPVRQPALRGNRLDTWQRVGWVLGITMLFAIAFGVLSTGLMAIGSMAQTVSADAPKAQQ